MVQKLWLRLKLTTDKQIDFNRQTNIQEKNNIIRSGGIYKNRHTDPISNHEATRNVHHFCLPNKCGIQRTDI